MRGTYNEIVFSSIPQPTQKKIQKLVSAAADAQKVDEHGNWEFGAEFDSKGRGSSLNWDVYAFGSDIHSRRFLAVIQVRQYVKARRNYYPSIRKSYFLLGRNEDNSVFAHPVESRVIHSAVKNGKNNKGVLVAVQSWIFGTDYRTVIRHGDVALVPLSRKPQGESVMNPDIVLQPEDGSASHRLTAAELRVNGNLYANNPHLVHEPGVHPDVSGIGWFKVVIGKRANFYDFAAPTID